MQIDEANPEVLVSGKTSFKIEVPYKLIETGGKTKQKPLIVYLHGYGDNIKTFENRCKKFYKLDAYHLYIQGPYPIIDHSGKKTVSNWGRSWYLYDGKRKQFIKSLELTSEFIQEIIDNLIKFITVSRLCIFGYSMGGYVAGYFALTRWKHVNDLIVAGARIKSEILNENDWQNLRHLDVLALHGINDTVVNYKNQEKEIEVLSANRISALFKLLDADHNLSDLYVSESINWLLDKGYKSINSKI